MEAESEMPRQPTFNLGFQHLETIKCDGGLQYPYHPIVSALDYQREMVVATRSRDSIAIFHITDKIEKSYMLNCEALPRSTITTIQLVPADLHEIVVK